MDEAKKGKNLTPVTLKQLRIEFHVERKKPLKRHKIKVIKKK